MKSKRWLWLVCLSLFFLGCDTNLPTSPEVVFPSIVYFRAVPSQISVGESSILSWNTHVVGLTAHHTLRVTLFYAEEVSGKLFKRVVLKEVERAGTMEVHPKTTTVYRLTAKVAGNSVSERVTISVGL